MLARLLFYLLLLVWGGNVFAQTGKLSGRVVEKDTKVPIPDVQVVVKLNDVVKDFAVTNDEGFYSIASLAPDTYSIEFCNTTFSTTEKKAVKIEANKIYFLNKLMREKRIVDVWSSGGFCRWGASYQLGQPDTKTLHADQIRRMSW